MVDESCKGTIHRRQHVFLRKCYLENVPTERTRLRLRHQSPQVDAKPLKDGDTDFRPQRWRSGRPRAEWPPWWPGASDPGPRVRLRSRSAFLGKEPLKPNTQQSKFDRSRWCVPRSEDSGLGSAGPPLMEAT